MMGFLVLSVRVAGKGIDSFIFCRSVRWVSVTELRDRRKAHRRELGDAGRVRLFCRDWINKGWFWELSVRFNAPPGGTVWWRFRPLGCRRSAPMRLCVAEFTDRTRAEWQKSR
jgi:hypothetical protein